MHDHVCVVHAAVALESVCFYGLSTRLNILGLLAKLENNMEMMPGEPISFDSDMRQEARYHTGQIDIALTISNMSASNGAQTRNNTKKILHLLVVGKIMHAGET